VRIIAGKFGGRKLKSFDEKHIRPTTDRVKESIFNILAPVIEGARVLDLYSGTGNLSIEALSRGAASVDSIELNPRSIKIIHENLELLKIKEGIRVHRGDAVRFITKYEGEPFDVILIDPPFPARVCMKTLEAIEANPKLTHQNTVIVIEHQRLEAIDEKIGTLTRIDSRSYGDKLVTFFKREGSPN